MEGRIGGEGLGDRAGHLGMGVGSDGERVHPYFWLGDRVDSVAIPRGGEHGKGSGLEERWVLWGLVAPEVILGKAGGLGIQILGTCLGDGSL